MSTRRIVLAAGISFCTAIIVFTVASGSARDNVEPAKAAQESDTEAGAIETLAKDLVSALADGDYEKAAENFDETMKKKVTAENLQAAWESLIDQIGPFAEQVGTRREKIQQYDVIFVTCKFEKGVLDTKVVFNSDKQVAGLFFVPSEGPAK